MASTVDETVLSSSPYTWASSSFTWQDALSNKAWRDAATTSTRINVGESLAVAEALQKHINLPFGEAFALTDAPSWHLVKNILRSLNIAETYTDNISFIIRITESFSIRDQSTKAVTKPLNESFSLVDALKKDITKGVTEALGMAEAFGRTIAYHLHLSEALHVSDALAKAVTLSKAEALHVFDTYLRHGNAVISDMLLTTADMTIADFKTLVDAGHAPGYADFKDFIQGDYEYRYALFRAVLESQSAARASLTGMSLQVDVPDVFDRGSAAITDAVAGITVSYNRQFHIPPEVTLTLKGGTVIAIPKLTNVTAIDFTVVLVDPATNNQVTGSFTWSAHGY